MTPWKIGCARNSGHSGRRPGRRSDTLKHRCVGICRRAGIGSNSKHNSGELNGYRSREWEGTFPCCRLGWPDSGVILGELVSSGRWGGIQQKGFTSSESQQCCSVKIRIKVNHKMWNWYIPLMMLYLTGGLTPFCYYTQFSSLVSDVKAALMLNIFK